MPLEVGNILKLGRIEYKVLECQYSTNRVETASEFEYYDLVTHTRRFNTQFTYSVGFKNYGRERNQQSSKTRLPNLLNGRGR